MALDVKKAKAELNAKTMQQIQLETAWTWASRAVAAYQLYKERGDLKWLLEGEAYADEAQEHAAFAGAGVLGEMVAALAPSRASVKAK